MTGSEVKVKPWGKVDKATLHKLVVDGIFGIEDTSFKNIDNVHERFFPHRELRNFRCNFANFSQAFDLNAALEGA
jgi:hypothetical protein